MVFTPITTDCPTAKPGYATGVEAVMVDVTGSAKRTRGDVPQAAVFAEIRPTVTDLAGHGPLSCSVR